VTRDDSAGWATRVIEATVDWFPHSIDPTSVTTDELSLAGLARCRRLLGGMVARDVSPDLAGVLARTL
jgi:hypothetical protein